MTKVSCNYTNCKYNNAPHAYAVGDCLKKHINIKVWYEGEYEIEHHECKSYIFENKGDVFRSGRTR